MTKCNCKKGPSAGDPIDLATGEEIYSPPADLTVYNPIGPSVTFARSWVSLGNPYDVGLGSGWTTNYNIRITTENGATGGNLYFPNGSYIPFTISEPSGVAVLPAGTPFQLLYGAGYYQILFKDGSSYALTESDHETVSGTTYYYYTLGEITDIAGNWISLNWEPSTLDVYNQDTGGDRGPQLQSISGSTGHPLVYLDYNSTTGFLEDIFAVTTNMSDTTHAGVAYTGFSWGPTGASPPNQQFVTMLDEVGELATVTYTGSSWTLASVPTQYSLGYTPYTNGEGSEIAPYLSSIQDVSATGSGTQTATISYTAGIVSQLKDANGNTTTPVLETSPLGAQVTVANSSGTTVEEYYAYWNTSTMAETSRALVTDAGTGTSITPLQITSFSTTDPYQPATIEDGNGLTWNLTWDAFGNLLTFKTPKGTTTTLEYNYSPIPAGEMSSSQTGSQTATTYDYYPNGQLETINSPIPDTTSDGTTQATTLTYTSLGQVASVTWPGNQSVSSHTLTFNYTVDGTYGQSEAIGEPLTVTDTLGYSSHLRYNDHGYVSSSWDPTGTYTTYAYSYNLADQLEQVTNPATDQQGTGNSYTLNTYLYPGGPLSETQLYDESGSNIRTQEFTYGNEGELLDIDTGGSELPVTFTYDGAYRLASVKDGNSHTTSYAYNPAGEMLHMLYPDGSSEVVYGSYDADGNLKTVTSARGVVKEYSYSDGDGLLSGITYPSYTAYNVGLTYDGYDRLTGLSDKSGTRALTYDDLNEVETDQTTYSGQSAVTLSYTHNPDTSEETMASNTSGTPTFHYFYDGDGRMTDMTNPLSETTAWSYENNGWLRMQTLTSGDVSTYTYNGLGELTQLNTTNSTDHTLSEFGSTALVPDSPLSYDGAGNLLKENDYLYYSSGLSGTITNTYDSRDQLASSASTRPGYDYSETFAADAGGNLTTLRGTSYTYSNRNGITASGYSYDGDGNLTDYGGSAVITYDPEDRMASYGGTTLQNVYRADGLRASKQNSSATTYFYYWSAPQIGRQNNLTPPRLEE